MTTLKQQMRQVIQEGLYASNLEKLLSLADDRFHQCPVLYGSLIYIFETLDREYGEQGLPTARYNHIVESLTQPLLDALDAESSAPQQFLDKLNILHSALRTALAE